MESQKEAISSSAAAHQEFSGSTPKIEQEDGAIILDVSAAGGQDGVAALKTASDGHVGKLKWLLQTGEN